VSYINPFVVSSASERMGKEGDGFLTLDPVDLFWYKRGFRKLCKSVLLKCDVASTVTAVVT
jgi:hypothetical protein